MSYQQEHTNMSNASSVINTETEPSTGGFATEAGEETLVSAVEKKLCVGPNTDLSMLPQTLKQCGGHRIWGLSKKCVVCKKTEYGGAVRSNLELFNHYDCAFIRACPDHHAMVSAHFAQKQFTDTESIRKGCKQCGGEIFSDRGGFCKECTGILLDQM